MYQSYKAFIILLFIKYLSTNNILIYDGIYLFLTILYIIIIIGSKGIIDILDGRFDIKTSIIIFKFTRDPRYLKVLIILSLHFHIIILYITYIKFIKYYNIENDLSSFR